MKPETRHALRLSIKKWEEIVAGTGVDLGALNCALCKRFNTGPNLCMDGGEYCPVAIDAQAIGCQNTPYIDFQLAVDTSYPRRAHDDESVMCAQLELEYLRSLDI